MNCSKLMDNMEVYLRSDLRKDLDEANAQDLHHALSKAIMAEIAEPWKDSLNLHRASRHAYYMSAEFLIGRAIYNNLLCLGIYDEVEEKFKEKGLDLAMLEEVEDASLGNGGLGRLAACFLDSAATLDLPLDGYGIRYRYGLFKQYIQDGFQKETADDWTRFGDPWSIRSDSEAVLVKFADQTVRAVPYDIPIIGYGTKHIGNLRLWQAESISSFDFNEFNAQHYDASVREKNRAEDISRVLYPNDSTDEGKKLRLKQQYFFCSASLQDIIKKYKANHGSDFTRFAEFNAIQLNDTHPVISIPELVRLLTTYEGVEFRQAVEIAKKTFAYTNHTILPEALEKWNKHLLVAVVPEIYDIIEKINNMFIDELYKQQRNPDFIQDVQIIKHDMVHMANLAMYGSSYVNGVAAIHTEILKKNTLHSFYELWPERFQNKTNGITQRRWLAMNNRELSALITRLLGSDAWVTDLTQLKKLEKYAHDEAVLDEFWKIKHQKKRQLGMFMLKHDGTAPIKGSIYDIQIKRLHEYKRQFLNALSILYIYYGIKDGSIQDFHPTTFIFGAKAAPGYDRAKGIIKLINEIAHLIENDGQVRDKIRVVFVSNYNVSYAEKLVAAANVSEQISTAGTEASGTGNMKLMLNGAVTLGTMDGANVEIVEEAGIENEYIFGGTVEEIEREEHNNYIPYNIYNGDPKIKRVMEALVNGTLNDGGTGIFRELYDSIIHKVDWGQSHPDKYFLMYDFQSYVDTKLRLNRDYRDKYAFASKCWMNICNAGKFSSDRTIKDYAANIWHIDPVEFD
ncbi:MAG TPA: glycogen/starch/alpha-glucan phosphorylase [Candidatus Butyricicoccus stercorigallinarum]|nr:glycogen/starch/alpha-glucan phosphorylase [Candidatus Butyricicoccus stercorigallinarum]